MAQDDLDARISRLIETARSSFSEAIDALGCLAILVAANTQEINAALKKAGAGHAAGRVHKALFQRVWMEVMTFFDPVRDAGDYHMRVAMVLLEDDDLFQAVAKRGDGAKLKEALSKYAAFEKDPRLERRSERGHRPRDQSRTAEDRQHP